MAKTKAKTKEINNQNNKSSSPFHPLNILSYANDH